MESDKKHKLMKDIALALLLLSSWEEKDITGEPVKRAWKGYDFGILDILKEEGLVDFSRTAKSLWLTQEGEKKAEEAVERFGRI